MSENEQNDSYEDARMLTDGAADSRTDSSAQFTPSTPAGQALAPQQVSEAERDQPRAKIFHFFFRFCAELEIFGGYYRDHGVNRQKPCK